MSIVAIKKEEERPSYRGTYRTKGEDEIMNKRRKEVNEHLNKPERILLIQGTKTLIMVRVPEGYDVQPDDKDQIAVLD